MVDARYDVVDFFKWYPDIVRQVLGRMLNTVAKSNSPYLRYLVKRPAIHGHRIDVVQMQDLGAYPLHFPAHVDEHRNRSHRAHDPANPKRVPDCLSQAVTLGNFKIGHSARPVTSNLYHIDRVGSSIKCPRAICRDFD